MISRHGRSAPPPQDFVAISDVRAERVKYKIIFASVNLVNVVNLKTNQNLQEFGNLKYNSNVKYKINLAIVNLVNLVNLKYN